MCLLLSVFISFSSYAQLDSLSLPESYFSAFIVENIDSSISWYEKTLGFSILNKNEYPKMGFKQANLKMGNTLIELIELQSAISLEEVLPDFNKKTKVIGIFKFGFTVTDFDKWILHLKKLNVNFHGKVVTDSLSKKRMAIILDVDNNRIQLFEK